MAIRLQFHQNILHEVSFFAGLCIDIKQNYLNLNKIKILFAYFIPSKKIITLPYLT